MDSIAIVYNGRMTTNGNKVYSLKVYVKHNNRLLWEAKKVYKSDVYETAQKIISESAYPEANLYTLEL